MRKNVITKIMTLAIAATMALTPVTASAAEKTVITATEFSQYSDDAWLAAYGYDVEASKADKDLRSKWLSEVDDKYTGGNDSHEAKMEKIYYNSVAAMDGSYQENGYKIYTALNGKTVTVKKTGNYSVIVGGKSAEKDQGSFKFVAPKTGTYKFTFSTKDNVAGGSICIDQRTNLTIPTQFKVNYKDGSDSFGWKKITKDASVLLVKDSKATAYIPYGRGLSDVSGNTVSYMTKISGSFKMKKGQWFKFTGRDCGARYDETNEAAYNFTGFDVQITKTK